MERVDREVKEDQVEHQRIPTLLEQAQDEKSPKAEVGRKLGAGTP